MLVTVKQRVINTYEFKIETGPIVSSAYTEELLKRDPTCRSVIPKTFITYDEEQVISTTIEDEDGNVLGKWVANTGK